MAKKRITVDVPEELLAKGNLSVLDTIFQKLDAEVRKPFRTKSEKRSGKMIEWSSKMTGYEIMILEQAVLLFQNLILTMIKSEMDKTWEVIEGVDGEDQET